MIIGHLPAGYVVAKLLFPYFESRDAKFKTFLWTGVLGAIAPDLDMVYFYLIDHRQHHHHTYFTHFPILWASLLLLSSIWFSVARIKSRAALATIFSLNGFIHMLLDTIVGDIWWFAPFIDKPFAFFIVPALYQPWWLNFVLHWSFALELVIALWGGLFMATFSPGIQQKLSIYFANDPKPLL
ncbi:MAG: metal-dependent hydrolase [Gammaproteobacteria bacterium]